MLLNTKRIEFGRTLDSWDGSEVDGQQGREFRTSYSSSYHLNWNNGRRLRRAVEGLIVSLTACGGRRCHHVDLSQTGKCESKVTNLSAVIIAVALMKVNILLG